MKNNRTLGQWGEQLAAERLQALDYRILERNWTHGRTEIDLIAMDGETLVFVEVKTRRDTRYGPPEQALTPRKTEAMLRGAEAYLAQHPCRRIRFDVVSIVLQPGAEPEWLHIRDVIG